jgi:tRNA(Ile)-lysidine synthase
MAEVCSLVADTIRREKLLRPRQKVVAAVSGGADSLCLLDCLARLGYPVIVAHLDHQLRPDSPEDARFVLEIAQIYGLPAVVAREEVRSFAGGGFSLEEAARFVRYRFLVRVAREHRARVIATGHTADDHVETILMHFIRGAGPEGLRGISPRTDFEAWAGLPEAAGLTLVRPLLALSRAQTIEHCARVGLVPREDSSNTDPAFFRNRLRHELLPILEGYNPGIREVLKRTGRVMRDQAELTLALAEAAWVEVARPAGKLVLALRTGPFLAQPRAVQCTLLRKALIHLRPGERDLGLETIERAQAFVSAPPRSHELPLVAGIEMVHLGNEVLLAEVGARPTLPDYPQLTSERQRRLEVPGGVALACGWRIEARLQRLSASQRGGWLRKPGNDTAALDADVLREPLSVRPPRAGDRIQPLGMEGTAKVADLLVNLHVPRAARSHWPLVSAGDEIVWVAGLRMAHPARLTVRSRRALILHLIRPKGQ